MGFVRQSKITGYNIGAKANPPTPKAKQRYAGWVAGEAKAKSKKSARKAKIYRAIGNAALGIQKRLKMR